MLRKEFTVAANATGFSRVSVFVSACQYYLLYLDGQRVGDRELDVVWTKFAENRSYSSYSLSPTLFTPGKHVVGLEIGQGFCGGNQGKADARRAKAGLLLINMYADSAKLQDQPRHPQQRRQQVVVQSVGTDGTWEASSGPVLWDSTYYGEDYDARLEQDGWSRPGFNQSWTAAQVQTVWPTDDTTRDTPPGPPWMSSQLMQPIKAVRTMAPVSMAKVAMPAGGVTYVYDFAREFAGVVQLRLPPMTASGTNITLKYAEALAHPGLAAGDSYDGGGGDVFDGRVYMKNLFWAGRNNPPLLPSRGGGDTIHQ